MEARERLIENMMSLYREERMKTLQAQHDEITRKAGTNGWIKGSPIARSLLTAFWDCIQALLDKRVALESEVPGGPSPDLREELLDILSQETTDSPPAIVLSFSGDSLAEAIHSEHSTIRGNVQRWIEVACKIVEDKHILGILEAGAERTMRVGTLHIGSAWIHVNTDMLNDMLGVLSDRLGGRDAELTSALMEIRDALANGKKPSNIERFADTVKRLDHLATILGPLATFTIPMLEKWLEKG